ncbi:DinB family protein [Ferdinandcohnia quinoae]|uniref:DinB family protein n=1 Tax=Fredinandcohnia quinoae TaxID=2918902 RepID=A0AAW5E2W5_9BACI|nr:DinB family protein [Fredinandcohnia sp. SECRCQ15]MCH1624432.1 DinB family protein [Fredinandcohnia sp. SECRCQ15]
MAKVDSFIQDWIRHRLVLQEMVELIDHKHIDFKPWDNAIPMGALIVHIVSSTDMFVKTVKNGTFTPPKTINQYQTIDEVRSIVNQLTEETTADLQSLTDEQLLKEINMNNYPGTGSFWLSTAKDHEIHHKGQLFTYARMVGVENVPFLVKQPIKNID